MASRPAPSIHASSRPGTQQPDVPQCQPSSQQHHQRRATTSKPLNFQQAMSDFSVMFPEIDRDVIETVLRANNGVVQTTIDQLLELQESAIVEQATDSTDFGHALPSYEASISIGSGEEPPPAYSDIWEDDSAPSPEPVLFSHPTLPVIEGNPISRQTTGRAISRNQFWGAPLIGKLRNDFLRIDREDFAGSNEVSNHTNGENSSIGINSSNNAKHNKRRTFSNENFMTDDDVEQFLEDEKLAIFLQNEEFLRELRRNREFVSSLDADHRQAMEASGTPVPLSPVVSGGARPRTTPTQEDAQFKQKLRHMGKSTKKKFGKIAKKFSRTKTNVLPKTLQSSESRFNLLDDEEPEDNRRSSEDLSYIDEEEEQSMFQKELDNSATNHHVEPLDERIMQRARPRPSVKNNRKLPQPPGGVQGAAAVGGNEEPIVFYGEDNEFSYKSDA